MRQYATRFVLPLLLLAGCLTSWFIADRLGNAGISTATGEQVDRVVTPLASIRRVPEFATASLQQDAIAVALATLPPDPGGLSCTTVLVNGVAVLERRGDRALAPSYAQLLITGYAATDILGPEYRYETLAMAEALPDANGRIAGGLYLVGGGDPVLMTQRYALSLRPALSVRTPIEDLIAQVVDRGVARIDGGIVGIERRYDTERALPGWPQSYADEGVIGPLTALQIDDGFAVRAAANGGVAVAAAEPATHTADRVAAGLEAAQVQVFGGSRTLADEAELGELIPLGRVTSPPLSQIVFQMMAANDAGAAELLLKELGVAGENAGSTQAGGRAVQGFLQAQGVEVAVPFRDGSGLDPLGGTSCRQLAGAADAIALDHPVVDSLPRYDLPGVFGGRLGSLDIAADVRAVGGVVGDASGLIARTVGNDSDEAANRVTFASIINRPGGPSASDLDFQQALVELVDELAASVSVAALAIAE